MPRHKIDGNNLELQNALRKFKANVFQALSHPVRVHIIELLSKGEMNVSDLLASLCIEQANASQHLAVLRAKNLVSTRKEGNQVFYSLRDPALAEVLGSLRRFFQSHLEESLEMLKTIN